MTRRFLLVRHGSHAELGRVLSGRSEIALDTRGREEVTHLAAALDGEAIASIHCSPRRRTRETAAPIASRRHLPVTITPALDEIDFGSFAGRSFADLDGDPDWQRWNAERGTFRCPGGEKMAEAVDRATAYLLALPATEAPALCVSHADIIRGLRARATGSGLGALFTLDCPPASVTALVAEGGALRLA